MKIRSISQLAVFAALMLFSCNESPFLSKDEALNLIEGVVQSRDPFFKVTNVVAIIDNDIYYFDRLDAPPRRLTHTPEKIKTSVKLSADKSLIAYINDVGHPVIIGSTNGAHIRTLSQYNHIRQMEWAKDGQTLIMLSGNELFSDGQAITLPSIETPMPFPWDVVISFSMNGVGDYGYYAKIYNSPYPKLKYVSSGKNILEEPSTFKGEIYDFIDFYDNKGGFMLGKKNPFGSGISKIVCVENYNFWPAYDWASEIMTTPKFNSDLQVLIYGTVADQVYQIKAVYLGTDAYETSGAHDILTKVLGDYTSHSEISLDWVY